MKPLLRIKPYLVRYKKTLLLGLGTVIGSNIFTVFQPMFMGFAIDELKNGIETRAYVTGDLLMWAGIIVGFSLVAGFFTFLTRQTIIVVSAISSSTSATTFSAIGRNSPIPIIKTNRRAT